MKLSISSRMEEARNNSSHGYYSNKYSTLSRGSQFCSRRLMPGVLSREAARQVTSFLAS